MSSRHTPLAVIEPSLFDLATPGPAGFSYKADMVSAAEAEALVTSIQDLPLTPFEFHGFEGRRRVASFGWRYDFAAGKLDRALPIPAFLEPLREKAAAFAGLDPASLRHALVTEYTPGAGIGWHRDRPEFDKVVGISLCSAATLRFRRKAVKGWDRLAVVLAPNSAYRLDGSARLDWEHSIAPGDTLRYSITFRSLREHGSRPGRP